jgi:hypothetical protein
MALVQVYRWLRERSVAHRRRQELSHAEVSFFRRWFLLYAPHGWRASVAHFLFYSLVSLLLLMLPSLFRAGQDSAAVSRQLAIRVALSHFAWLALLARYWAVVERHWSVGDLKAPSSRARLLLWYKPVNGSELLARLLLFFACYDLLLLIAISLFAPELSPSEISHPSWHRAAARLLLAWSLLLAYFWSRAEYLAFQSGGARPRFPHNLRFLYTPSSPEGWAALISFWVFACWTMVQLWHGSLPAKLYNMAAMAGAVISWLVRFCTSALLPLYGSYLWALAAYRKKASRRINIG